jgi:protein involved in polysaccharide export with SLBB domain
MNRGPDPITRAVLALALAGLGMFALAIGGEAVAATEVPDYRLGSGDKIRVIVYGEDDLGGEFQVDATGQVRLPLIGQVKAGGLTARDVETGITAALANGYLNHPRVNVEVTTYRPFYVVGEVEKPGEYPYSNGMNAASAVALAGGFTPRAVESIVYVRHEGEASEERVAPNQEATLRPGDVVRVNTTPFWDVMNVLLPVATLSTFRYVVP